MKIVDKESGKVIVVVTEDTVELLDTKNYEVVQDEK